jgi:CRISPR system Cascade subunit CasB
MDQERKETGRGGSFIKAVLPRLKTDKAFSAALKRADNPATEYQAWEHLVRYGCDIENTRERLAYATVAAALARAKIEKDGTLDLGASIADCFDSGNDSDSARAKLRRLLACADSEEACQIVRPLLGLIASRGAPVAYGRLLDELLYFGERVKLSWAQSFYHAGGSHQ